jgi:hypothetical protein
VIFGLILLSMFITASFTGYLADEKGYRQFEWMVIGFLFGPLGLIGAVGLPDKKLRKEVRQQFEDIRELGIDTRPQSYPPVKKGPFNNSGDLPAIPKIPNQ